MSEFCGIFGVIISFESELQKIDVLSSFLIRCDLVASSNSFESFFPVLLDDAFNSNTLKIQKKFLFLKIYKKIYKIALIKSFNTYV